MFAGFRFYFIVFARLRKLIDFLIILVVIILYIVYDALFMVESKWTYQSLMSQRSLLFDTMMFSCGRQCFFV